MTTRGLTISFLCLTLSAAAAGAAAALDALVERELPSLVAIYKTLHASPELSRREERTSAFLAKELRSIGFEVTERVGKYSRPDWIGFGVVAVMKNGGGPTLLVRTDLDGLPVEEKTGLPYASTVRTKDEAGQEVGVMHACGHDLHITSLIGTARVLAGLKDQWRGTLVLIGQPAEEVIQGARAMLADGLYTRFPRPDHAIALHDAADLAAGKVACSPGHALASSTSVDIVVRGVGGHGSRPEAAKDPIVLAAQIVLGLQTIVSREVSPLDPAVVTVGSIHGGSKRNIIPDDVTLQLTVRTYSEEVRRKILSAIERISRGIALAAGVPDERLPIIEVSESEAAPPTYNDPELTRRLAAAFEKVLGSENVVEKPPVMGSEDFGHFGLEGRQIPISMFWLGAADPAKVERSRKEGTPLPSLHSSQFAPPPEPTLRTGVKAMTAAVLELLGR